MATIEQRIVLRLLMRQAHDRRKCGALIGGASSFEGEDEASSVSIFQRLYFTFLGLARLDTMGDQLGYQDIIMNVDTSLAASAHVSRQTPF